MAIVTVSRQLASGGDAIALGVAQALGSRVVDQGIINQAAVKAGVPRSALEELKYEGHRNLADRMLSVVHSMPAIPTTLESSYKDASTASNIFGGFLSPLRPPMSISMHEYVGMVGMVIRNLAQDGNVVIVGQGGQVVLKDTPGVLHVQVIASFARRVATLMERRGIDRREATTLLRDSDRARQSYLQRYHGVNWQSPRLYNLILNTDTLAISAAVAAIVGACKELDKSICDIDPVENLDAGSKEPD